MILFRLRRIPAASVEPLESLLQELGALAVTVEDAADQPVLEPAPGETPLWDTSDLSALFSAETEADPVILGVQSRLDETGLTRLPDWRWEILEEKDWARAWMDHYHPIPFGDRLWICPSWETPPDPEAVNLMLDPGLAFGTGTHPTTALCMRWLNDHPVTDHTVLDYGCGSGVLGIAALLLGAREMIGVDIDPQAVRSTAENAARNNIDPKRYRVFLPDDAPAVAADTVLANILAGPLISLRPTLLARLNAHGHLILSGLIRSQVDRVLAEYQPYLYDIAVQYEDDWACIHGRRIDSNRLAA